MLRSLLALCAVAALSLALVACDGDDEDGTPSPIVPTASLTLTASPEASETPVAAEGDRRTGDPQLDAIIEAVEARDVTALAELVEYQQIGCTFAQGLGGPPKCEPGMTEGEETRMFPVASCEGTWTRTATQVLGSFVQDTRGLYAAAEPLGDSSLGGEWPVADTLLVFHVDDTVTPGIRLHVADGRIVGLWINCAPADPLSELLEAGMTDGANVIAGPWDEPIDAPTAPPPSTGAEAVDSILAAVARYDAVALRESALRAMGDLPPAECEEPPLQGPGGVECDPKNGEVAGDPVSVFPIAHCEGVLERDPMDPIRGFLNGAPVLHAVAEAPSEPSPSELYPHGAYWLVYELPGLPDGTGEGVRLHVTAEGDLTAIWYGCAPPLEELLQYEGQPLPEIEVTQE